VQRWHGVPLGLALIILALVLAARMTTTGTGGGLARIWAFRATGTTVASSGDRANTTHSRLTCREYGSRRWTVKQSRAWRHPAGALQAGLSADEPRRASGSDRRILR
jgi:hypothetical protein